MLVMLDLDNTLADRSGAVAAWADEFCSDHGLGPEARSWIIEADNDGYSDRVTVFSSIRSRFDIDIPIEALVADYRRRVIELTRPTPGAVSCLTGLREAGHMLAIVSNGSSSQQHGKIDALGFRDLVDAVVISGDLGIKKPDRAMFDAAVEQTGAGSTSPSDPAWMVGDSPLHDIVGAKAVGARTAWLHRGRTWDTTAERPDLILDSVETLPAELVSFGSSPPGSSDTP